MVVPYHYPQCPLALLRPGTMVKVFYFLFVCVKGPLCIGKLRFLLTRYYFTPNANYTFWICKI